MSPLGPDTASRVAAEWARSRPSVPRGPEVLVLGDASAHLACALEDSGFLVTRWHRFATEHPGNGASWPPPGPFREVWVRMPRSGREASMLLHAAAHRVGNGDHVFVFGARNEGIRSVARRVPAGTEPPRTLRVKRRCRVLCAQRTGPPPRPDGLQEWAVRAKIDWGTGKRPWTFYPGVFACGRLDPATQLLIDRLPRLPGGARVLDYGGGTGIIAAAALERAKGDISVQLLDPDLISLAAAARNVPGVTRIPGQNLAPVTGLFDLIVSNPPVHAGSNESTAVLAELGRGAPAALAGGGRLLLVTQRRLPAQRLLSRHFREVETEADRGPFRVWSASGRRRRAPRRRQTKPQPYRPSM